MKLDDSLIHTINALFRVKTRFDRVEIMQSGKFVINRSQLERLVCMEPLDQNDLKRIFTFLATHAILFIPIPERDRFGFMSVTNVLTWRQMPLDAVPVWEGPRASQVLREMEQATGVDNGLAK
jgi:hypothetical protein